MRAISPDGKWVVYSQLSPAFPDNDSYQIIIQSTEGQTEGDALEPERVGQLHQADMHPRFSPDGKWIVFASSRGGFNDEWLSSVGLPQPYGEIWVIPIENGKATGPAIRLTYDKWENSLPYWADIETK
jgi:Tol biopolymer transport system component